MNTVSTHTMNESLEKPGRLYRLTRMKFATPVDKQVVEATWDGEGYGCDWYTAPAGRTWIDCVHKSNALLAVVDGKLAVRVHGERMLLKPGDELLIPRGAVHSVENAHTDTTNWLYGFDVSER